MISVCLPHAMNEENDKVLQLNLNMLRENTTCPYEVLILSNMGRADLVYKGWDFLMRNAKYDLLLWQNSDILMSPRWNENVLKYQDNGDWIGLELVECGMIGVSPTNIHQDFGITADTFRREDFEDWVKTYSENRLGFRKGFGWYSPSVFKKSWYVSMGGFNTEKSFPHPNDMEFKEKAEKLGQRFIVVNSFAYHFQRAGENMGEKPERKNELVFNTGEGQE